ncbi:MAG: AAA family ATPase [Ardenticatenales bacterium]|nr:AAA family ATPase [Ardenticatenales bacterium]
MIDSIQIRDFRGIQHGQIKGFRQLNILVGPNNSGKSALMEALYLTGTVARPATLQAQYGESISYDVTVAAADLSGKHPQTRLWERAKAGSREGYNKVISGLKGKEGVLEPLRSSISLERVLLLFDQENDQQAEDRCRKIEADLRWSDPDGCWQSFTFESIAGWPNIFEHYSNKLHIVLHIADVRVEGLQGADFDGYLLQLLQGPASQNIAEKLLATQSQLANRLLKKGEEEFTVLMQSNGHPWTHAKSWLYAYITAFQFRQSHVWFARDIVEKAPEDQLRQVFASLIAAWECLIHNVGELS